jgi:uncharacterized protein DUF1833
MPRTLSPPAIASLMAQETASIWIGLLTITHPSIATPILLSSDPTTRMLDANGQPYYVTNSRGNSYKFLPFRLVLPDDRPDQAPLGSIAIDNIDRTIAAAVQAMGFTPANILIELIVSDDLDQVVMEQFLTIRDVTVTVNEVTCRLGFEEIFREQWPPHQFTPATAPGVFSIAA